MTWQRGKLAPHVVKLGQDRETEPSQEASTSFLPLEGCSGVGLPWLPLAMVRRAPTVELRTLPGPLPVLAALGLHFLGHPWLISASCSVL